MTFRVELSVREWRVGLLRPPLLPLLVLSLFDLILFIVIFFTYYGQSAWNSLISFAYFCRRACLSSSLIYYAGN